MTNQHKKIVIYTKQTCPFCLKAKNLLQDKGLTYEEVAVDNNLELHRQMTEAAGRTSVPQIWIGNIHIGGCDDLYIADSNGRLDYLLHNTD